MIELQIKGAMSGTPGLVGTHSVGGFHAQELRDMTLPQAVL